jgi:beta-glucosidase
MSRDGTISVSIAVTNTGKLAGKETAIVYVRDEVATVTPPSKRVRRFAKVGLRPAESKTLTFTLSPEDFSYVGLDNKSVLEAGEFTIMVGGQSARFSLR